MTKKESAIKLFLKGNKAKEIADMINITEERARVLVRTVPIDVRLKNLELYKYRMDRGYVQWNEYILSPNRKNVLRMAKNGLWVEYKPTKKAMGNKIFRRLGSTYLNVVERELKERGNK